MRQRECGEKKLQKDLDTHATIHPWTEYCQGLAASNASRCTSNFIPEKEHLHTSTDAQNAKNAKALMLSPNRSEHWAFVDDSGCCVKQLQSQQQRYSAVMTIRASLL